MMLKIAIVALLATSAFAVKPMDLPCVTWEPLTSDDPTPDPSTLFIAARTYVTQFGPTECYQIGDIIPCFGNEPGVYNWGHHDYLNGVIDSDKCRTWTNGSVTFNRHMYIPKKGPKYQTWKWHAAQKGGVVPDNAIRYGEAVMARSTVNPPGECAGKGFVGWAVGQKDGTFGDVHFSIVNAPFTTTTFEVAVCEAYHPTTTVAPPTPVPTTTTGAPATPPPTVSPTLPPNNKPYIRFANTVAADHKITATITQGTTNYTWTDYPFGKFSSWVEIFSSGEGIITLVDSDTGSQLLSTAIPLTPGPLVVAVKDYWPPSQPSNVETIAASYVPVASGSGVRLFNLSPDTASASMSSGGSTLVSDVKYSIGSIWASIPAAKATFAVTDYTTGKSLATDTYTAPPAPFVFTNFLIGLQNATDAAYKTQLVPLVDAPES